MHRLSLKKLVCLQAASGTSVVWLPLTPFVPTWPIAIHVRITTSGQQRDTLQSARSGPLPSISGSGSLGYFTLSDTLSELFYAET